MVLSLRSGKLGLAAHCGPVLDICANSARGVLVNFDLKCLELPVTAASLLTRMCQVSVGIARHCSSALLSMLSGARIKTLPDAYPRSAVAIAISSCLADAWPAVGLTPDTVIPVPMLDTYNNCIWGTDAGASLLGPEDVLREFFQALDAVTELEGEALSDADVSAAIRLSEARTWMLSRFTDLALTHAGKKFAPPVLAPAAARAASSGTAELDKKVAESKPGCVCVC